MKCAGETILPSGYRKVLAQWSSNGLSLLCGSSRIAGTGYCSFGFFGHAPVYRQAGICHIVKIVTIITGSGKVIKSYIPRVCQSLTDLTSPLHHILHGTFTGLSQDFHETFTGLLQDHSSPVRYAWGNDSSYLPALSFFDMPYIYHWQLLLNSISLHWGF